MAMDEFALTTLALEHLAEAVLLVDSEGQVVYANLQAKALFAPTDLASTGYPFSAPIQTDQPVEILVPRAEDADRVVEMQVVPLQTGRATLSLISLRDVTERHQAAARLLEREELYRSVIERAHDGFWITDLTACIAEVNDAYLCMTGYRREEVIGLHMQDVEIGASARMVADRIATLRVKGSTLFETRHRARDGRIIHVEVGISYSPVAGGRLFVFLRDITPRKQAEADTLAAKALAEQANRAKSEFLSNMSHDLRTPLNAIIGFAELMRTEVDGPLGSDHYREYVQGIEDSGSLLVSLVNDVLDLSTIESGQYEILSQSLALEPLMRRAVTQTAVLGNGHGAEIVAVECPNNLRILGDDRALGQVFNNILSNALKFNRDHRPIRFVAALRNPNDAGEGLDILVIDEGIGMDEETARQVLEPFEMIDSLHPRRRKGSGLGVYLSTQVMQLLGGELTLHSTPSLGTTVTLWLPANRVVTGLP